MYADHTNLKCIQKRYVQMSRFKVVLALWFERQWCLDHTLSLLSLTRDFKDV